MAHRLGQGELNRSAADEDSQPYEECLSELKKENIVHGLLTDGTETGLSQIINCKKFGSFERLIATTSLVLKFCRRLLNKVRAICNSFDPRAEAEHRWILESQGMVKFDRKFEQWRRQLYLFQDDKGVWRCRGSIQNAAVPYSTKHPVLLHKDHPSTFLVTQKAHEQVLHNGVKETLTQLRSRFWIVIWPISCEVMPYLQETRGEVL